MTLAKVPSFDVKNGLSMLLVNVQPSAMIVHLFNGETVLETHYLSDSEQKQITSIYNHESFNLLSSSDRVRLMLLRFLADKTELIPSSLLTVAELMQTAKRGEVVTVKVAASNDQNFTLINGKDFDSDVHTLWKEENEIQLLIEPKAKKK